MSIMECRAGLFLVVILVALQISISSNASPPPSKSSSSSSSPSSGGGKKVSFKGVQYPAPAPAPALKSHNATHNSSSPSPKGSSSPSPKGSGSKGIGSKGSGSKGSPSSKGSGSKGSGSKGSSPKGNPKGKNYGNVGSHNGSNHDTGSHNVSSGNHTSCTLFDVRAFGAKGDGACDDTVAFQSAWAKACQVDGATLLVPQDHTFVVGPSLFSGPCQANIVFQMDGNINSPNSIKAWSNANTLYWIQFAKLRSFRLQGAGVIDGKGQNWWNTPCKFHPNAHGQSCDNPTAVRFYGSYNVTVNGLTIFNSPQDHLKFDSCMMVHVNDIYINSPGNSPNTDGIHLQDTRLAVIEHSVVQCGDDCISIQTGTSDVYISNMVCGPGHGISIGGLGKGQTQACVSNISVHDVVVHNSLNGVRIKTWQGGSGSVRQILFQNVSVYNVSFPIVIDQFYCDGKVCHNQTSAVTVTDVLYRNIKGTYSQANVHLACSDTSPCTGILAEQIDLVSQRGREIPPFCWNSYGSLKSKTYPPLDDCLAFGRPNVTGKPQWNLERC